MGRRQRQSRGGGVCFLLVFEKIKEQIGKSMLHSRGRKKVEEKWDRFRRKQKIETEATS